VIGAPKSTTSITGPIRRLDTRQAWDLRLGTTSIMNLIHPLRADGSEPAATPKWVTSEKAWNSQRDVIKELYLQQDKTIKEVMAIMEREHHFKAK
jgi:hypothetical protein